MITAKDLKNFMKNIPDNAVIILNDKHIMFWYNHECHGLNKWGGIWDNGVGYAPGGTSVCGECTHFDCSKCRKELGE